MNNEKIKLIFFNYNCSIFSLLREKTNLKESDLKIILNNKVKWTEEFKQRQEQVMINSNYYQTFLDGYSKYIVLCNNYNDYYRLASIIYEAIINKKYDCNDLFIYYYELLICNFHIDKKESNKYINLFDYLINENKNKLRDLINNFFVVSNLHKDTFSEYCKSLEIRITNYIKSLDL